jgi:hypothetical protein
VAPRGRRGHRAMEGAGQRGHPDARHPGGGTSMKPHTCPGHGPAGTDQAASGHGRSRNCPRLRGTTRSCPAPRGRTIRRTSGQYIRHLPAAPPQPAAGAIPVNCRRLPRLRLRMGSPDPPVLCGRRDLESQHQLPRRTAGLRAPEPRLSVTLRDEAGFLRAVHRPPTVEIACPCAASAPPGLQFRADRDRSHKRRGAVGK